MTAIGVSTSSRHSHQFDDARRADRRLVDLDAERRERVLDRGNDGGDGGNRSSLAGALHAERVRGPETRRLQEATVARLQGLMIAWIIGDQSPSDSAGAGSKTLVALGKNAEAFGYTCANPVAGVASGTMPGWHSAQLQLYGHHPFQDEPDPRPLPAPDAVGGAVADIFDALVATLP
jgi:hypothetical protein